MLLVGNYYLWFKIAMKILLVKTDINFLMFEEGKGYNVRSLKYTFIRGKMKRLLAIFGK